MPTASAPLAVLAQVVHEHAVGRRQAHALAAQLVDLGLGLVHALLARDDHGVEQLREGRAVVAAGAHRVRDQPGPHALRARSPQRRDHLVVRADVAEHPVHEPGAATGLQLEQLAEARGEPLLGQLAALERAHVLERARVLAEQPLDRVRIEALVVAEGAEGLEHVRREHAAEVDQEALHECAISRAFSASIGTPRSKSARYWSSELPDWKRL
jgi:hypothetical protein